MAETLALDDVAVFLEVASCNSFVEAGRRLGMPQSSVSRRVAALESRVGTPLIRRTTRKLVLTPEGERLVKLCAEPVAQVRATLNDLAALSAAATNTMSIAVSPYICPDAFRAWVTAFGIERPDLQLKLTMNGDDADFVADGVDLAIQMGPPKLQSLVSVKLYDVPFRLVVSNDLLRRQPELGMLTDPMQLLGYNCAIILPFTDWWFMAQDGKGRQVTPNKIATASNDAAVVKDAVIQGRAVGLLPQASIDDRLVTIDIAGWIPVPSSVHAVFPQRYRNTQKIRAALESVRRRGNSNPTEGGDAYSSRSEAALEG